MKCPHCGKAEVKTVLTNWGCEYSYCPKCSFEVYDYDEEVTNRKLTKTKKTKGKERRWQ